LNYRPRHYQLEVHSCLQVLWPSCNRRLRAFPVMRFHLVLAVSSRRAYYVLTRRLARGRRKTPTGARRGGSHHITTNITKRAVDACKARRTDSYLWDRELSGFGLKVTPAGRKVYLVQYRLGGRKGRTRRVTIGQHGELTPTFARAEAKRLLGGIAAGRDPAAERDKAKAGKSLAVVLEQFMAEHVRPKLKASTAGGYQRVARLYVLPSLGRRSIGEVTRADIARLHREMSAKPYQANSTLAMLSKFFGWAEKHGLRPDGSNPCRHVDKYREGRRERFLSQAELARLGDALREAASDNSATPWTIAAIRLLMFTGARRNEILTLRWEYVSEEHGCLMLPDSKTGRKAIHLNPPALALLQTIPRREGNPYVICGEKAGQHLVNLEKPWRRIRNAAKLEDVRLYDLRHSFASVAASGGQSLVVIGKMLGHSQPATTARYAHLADDPVKAASDAVGRHIAAAMEGASADLVSLGSRKAQS
jgi:integrase